MEQIHAVPSSSTGTVTTKPINVQGATPKQKETQLMELESHQSRTTKLSQQPSTVESTNSAHLNESAVQAGDTCNWLLPISNRLTKITIST